MYQKQFKDTKDVQLYSEAVWHSLQDQKKRDKKINNNQRNTTKTVVDPVPDDPKRQAVPSSLATPMLVVFRIVAEYYVNLYFQTIG